MQSFWSNCNGRPSAGPAGKKERKSDNVTHNSTYSEVDWDIRDIHLAETCQAAFDVSTFTDMNQVVEMPLTFQEGF